jgi:hypothetical protein
MLWAIRIIGLGILVGILSMMIAAVLFKNGSEKDVALIYVAIMYFIVIAFVAKAFLKRAKESN